MRQLERSMARLLIINLVLCFFQPLLLCQIKQIDQEIWSGTDGLFHHGMPVLLPSHAHVLRNKPTQSFQKNPHSGIQFGTTSSDLAMFEPLPGPPGGTVRSIAVDSGGWLFIATDGEVYRSVDNGLNWDMNLFPSQLHNSVEPVTVLGPNVLVAETDFDNFISTNRGDSWSFLFEDVQGFAVDTTGEIYAGSNNNGVKKSIDTAKSWTSFALDGNRIWKVVLYGEGKFACPSDSGIYYSVDTGKTWVFRPHETPFTWNLVTDKRGHLFVLRYYGQDFQLFRSDDFGQTWERVILPVQAEPYRVYAEGDGRLFVPTDNGILTSTDSGDSWSVTQFPIGGALTVGHDVRGNLLAGSFYGIYKYTDSTDKWMALNNGIHARRIESITFTQSGAILALSLGTYFRSTDSGVSWSSVYLDSTIRAYPYAPLLSTSWGDIFTAASFDNYSEIGLLRSTDDGVTWSRISVLSNYYAIFGIAEGASETILVPTSYGDIYRSTERGNSWSKEVSGSSQSRIRCIASDKSGNSYAATDASVLFSRDGRTWAQTPLPRDYSSWESISIDAQGDVFLGSSSNGVYHSHDAGSSWTLLNTGLFDQYVMATTADDSGNVILGTSSGVFRLADSSNNWLRYSGGFPRTFTSALAISPQGFLFAGTHNFGIYRTVAPLGKRNPWSERLQISDFKLHQNYPNPFNNQTVIQFEVPASARIEVKVYNVLGQLVKVLFAGELTGGRHQVNWSPERVPSGIYFCDMTASLPFRAYRKTIKLLYLR